MPGNDLLSSLDALALITFAGHRWLRFSEPSIRDRVGDFAIEALHIHIWVSAAVWNPEPGACTTIGWAGREVIWDFVGG